MPQRSMPRKPLQGPPKPRELSVKQGEAKRIARRDNLKDIHAREHAARVREKSKAISRFIEKKGKAPSKTTQMRARMLAAKNSSLTSSGRAAVSTRPREHALRNQTRVAITELVHTHRDRLRARSFTPAELRVWGMKHRSVLNYLFDLSNTTMHGKPVKQPVLHAFTPGKGRTALALDDLLAHHQHGSSFSSHELHAWAVKHRAMIHFWYGIATRRKN